MTGDTMGSITDLGAKREATQNAKAYDGLPVDPKEATPEQILRSALHIHTDNPAEKVLVIMMRDDGEGGIDAQRLHGGLANHFEALALIRMLEQSFDVF